jgi:hypothetical protein
VGYIKGRVRIDEGGNVTPGDIVRKIERKEVRLFLKK